MTVHARGATPREKPLRRLVGGEGIWTLVGADLTLFALLFGVFSHSWRDNLGSYRVFQRMLNANIAFADTLILLTSSLFVALAMSAFRRVEMQVARRHVLAAIALGASFCILKLAEYWTDSTEGIRLDTSTFFSFYFMITGIHLVHVVIGLIALTVMFTLSRTRISHKTFVGLFEQAATFWHMVDLLWVFIFPVIYLVH